MENSGKVYKTINLIQKDLNKVGITKAHKNVQQGYSFRGIDDVYNALAPLMAEHGLCIMPRVLSRTATERTSKSGTIIFSVIVDVEFDFICSEDGSKHTVKIFGEAMDSGDKATNKALSAAYKYACLEAFAIPTEGDNDIDANTHEIAAGIPTVTRTPAAAEAVKVDGDVLTFVPSDVEVKPGDGPKGAYIKYTVKVDGKYISTFDETQGQILESARASAREVKLIYKKSGKYYNIAKVMMVEDTSKPDPEPQIEEVPF